MDSILTNKKKKHWKEKLKRERERERERERKVNCFKVNLIGIYKAT
jgi:hypothetical protein